MKILSFEILREGDSVECVKDNEVHVRNLDGTYIVYKLHTENPQILSFDAFIIKKGNGFLSLKPEADLNDLDEQLGSDNE